MVPTLEISPDFTIEDIHRVRENNYEATKHMTVEENCIIIIHQEQMRRSR